MKKCIYAALCMLLLCSCESSKDEQVVMNNYLHGKWESETPVLGQDGGMIVHSYVFGEGGVYFYETRSKMNYENDWQSVYSSGDYEFTGEKDGELRLHGECDKEYRFIIDDDVLYLINGDYVIEYHR